MNDRTIGGMGLVTIELWDASCHRLALSDQFARVSSARFSIPPSAAWMTVTSTCEWLCMSFSGAALSWQLR